MTRERLALSQMMKRLAAADEDPLSPLIDEYIIERDHSPRRYTGHATTMVPRPRPPGRLSPSSLCSCERQAVLKFTGVKGSRSVDVDQQLLFEDGHWRHHKWQHMFYDMEAVLGRNRIRVVSIEEPVSIPDLYIAGSLDAVLAIKSEDGKWRKYVIDIKGINRRGFDWITQTDHPKDDNVRQVLAYMVARKVKRGFLLYDCKDNSRTKVFHVNFNGEHWDEALAWQSRVVTALERKRLPSRSIECKAGTMLHDGCPFRKVCWSHTMDNEDLRELAYDSWDGIDSAWQRGLALENSDVLD